MSRTRRRTRPTARPTPSSRKGLLEDPRIVAGLSGGAALALYLATAARDIVVSDPAEFVIVAFTGGVAHPPGYPLLTVLGRMFAALPLDPLPFRASLVSVVAGAASVAVVALTARRLGAPGIAAVAGAIAFATSPVVWRWSVVAEAFPLNDLLVAGIVLALVAWQARARSVLPVAAGGVLGGLALTDHQTAGLIVPAVVLAMWRQRDALRARPGLIAVGAATFLVGLTPYAYVPLASAADPAWNWGRVASPGDMWALVTRQDYGTGQLITNESLRGGSALARVGLLLGSYWPIEWVLVVAGAAAAFARQRWYLWQTVAALALAGPGFAAYADIDPSKPLSAAIFERFFLLSHVITAPLLGLGIAWLAAVAASITSWRPATAVANGAVAAAVLALAVATYPLVDRRDDHVARSFALDILASVEPNTVLMTVGDDSTTTVSYLELVERVRPDVIHVMQPLLNTSWYVRELRRRHPDLAIPWERLGPASTLRQLVEANPGRTFAVVQGVMDESLGATHYMYTHGLVSLLRRLPPSGTVDDLARENDALLARYRFPSADQVRDRAWERTIRGDYARPAYLVGQQYEIAKRYREARAWYERALSIDPEQSAARAALARLPRT